jgi:glycosyltransferase involved in cell wall biosynthesis
VKILLLITDLEIGGTPTVVRELAIRLSPSIGVTVACLSRWGPVADQLKAAGVPVIVFSARGAVDLISATKQLISLVRTERFDTVFSFLIHANTVAALASPFVRDVRFLQSIQTTQPTPRWHWRLQSLVHHAAERVVVPSPSAARAAMDWGDVPAEKLVVIPNAVNSTSNSTVSTFKVQVARWRTARAHAANTHTIGFIGRLDPIKRIPDLLEAAALLDEAFRVHVYGEGEDRQRIENTIARLNLQHHVTLHGAIAWPTEALAMIDVLVLPSAAEGFGLVLIEAMAAGVPVVATDVPGICDVVENEVNGLLVPVGSPAMLAAAIRRVCEDGNLRNRLIVAALADVQVRFSWEKALAMYQNLLLG